MHKCTGSTYGYFEDIWFQPVAAPGEKYCTYMVVRLNKPVKWARANLFFRAGERTTSMRKYFAIDGRPGKYLVAICVQIPFFFRRHVGGVARADVMIDVLPIDEREAVISAFRCTAHNIELVSEVPRDIELRRYLAYAELAAKAVDPGEAAKIGVATAVVAGAAAILLLLWNK